MTRLDDDVHRALVFLAEHQDEWDDQFANPEPKAGGQGGGGLTADRHPQLLREDA